MHKQSTFYSHTDGCKTNWFYLESKTWTLIAFVHYAIPNVNIATSLVILLLLLLAFQELAISFVLGKAGTKQILTGWLEKDKAFMQKRLYLILGHNGEA